MNQNLADFPLIPRDNLFGNPTKAGGQISPDGKWLSWLAPVDGVLNIWMAPKADPSAAKAMTAAKDRPIREYFWAGDSKSLLYIQDKAGDENFLLYRVDAASGEETTLTPFENTRIRFVGGSHEHKDKVLIGLNNRDPSMHDIYLLDVNSGSLTEKLRNEENYAGFLADDELVLRMALKQNAEGGADFFKVIDGKVEDEPFTSTGLEDSMTTSPAGFTADGSVLYWIDGRGRDRAALIAEDVASGEKTLIAEHDKADVGGTMRDTKTGVVQAWSANYLRREWHAIDEGIGKSLEFLKERLPGDFAVQSRTEEDDVWIIGNDPLTAPSRTFIYDRTAGTLEPFYVTRPELEGAPLVAMYSREIATRDGLTLPSFLTLPPGTDADGDGKPDAPVPLVLLVHGGPWARDAYGFNPMHQWLANRGYAVLSVNYRGSTGFGKGFINAANLEWAGKMHDDLIDAVEWAIGEGITARDKVAIMGGSYGGYATLVGLTFTPEVFACGVDIVGPSNLETLLETIPPYWKPVVKQFHQRMGNPETPEGLQLLKDRSPLHRANAICRPLLIAQGANDPRVKQSESDQIVEAMERDGTPVTYVVFPDEGHGFARPENNLAFTAISENFLAECLGGRAEPVGDTLGKSTAEIRTGKDHVKGLVAEDA
ncbi:prolyl oligopeptidase family serine peptidase [Altererythrobacter salegens]|uniref:Prolyl oligopeptidase family serine peptidase n=1 Tax=Croceibacterium salegens TaxID=1737568 RepID=A0A6I4SUA2_9SPHN|nr:S9 family peptidase [Croceibacterium salegens]MXO58042.1 prolyl oligopeptidase family serine peptidase [Croceibacterium salegens]